MHPSMRLLRLLLIDQSHWSFVGPAAVRLQGRKTEIGLEERSLKPYIMSIPVKSWPSAVLVGLEQQANSVRADRLEA